MEKSAKIEGIMSQVRQLDYETRIYLIERIVRLLKRPAKSTRKNKVKLSDLNNKGSEIWQNVNIDKYVQQERQWD